MIVLCYVVRVSVRHNSKNFPVPQHFAFGLGPSGYMVAPNNVFLKGNEPHKTKLGFHEWQIANDKVCIHFFLCITYTLARLSIESFASERCFHLVAVVLPALINFVI